MCVALQPLTPKWRSHVRPQLDVTIRVEVTHDVTLCPTLIVNAPNPAVGSICSSLVLWSQPTCVIHACGFHHCMQVLELVVLPLCSAPTAAIENPPMYRYVMIHFSPSKSTVDHAKRLNF